MQNLIITGPLTAVSLIFIGWSAGLGGGITHSLWEGRKVYQISLSDPSFKMGSLTAVTIPLTMALGYLVTVIWEKCIKEVEEDKKNFPKKPKGISMILTEDRILTVIYLLIFISCNLPLKENWRFRGISYFGGVLGMAASSTLCVKVINWWKKSDSK